MKLSLSQAAKESGKVKSTIQKAIKDGRLSASKNDKGQYEIDPSELFRVFPKNGDETEKSNKLEQPETGRETAYSNVLEREIEMLREMLAKSEEALERERANTDEWRKQAQTLALTDQRSKGRSGLFSGLFKKTG